MKLAVWLFVLSLLISSATAHSSEPQSIEIGAGFEHANVLPYAQFKRVDERIQLSQIQSMDNWSDVTDTLPLASQQALWIRFKLRYVDSLDTRFALVISNPSIDFLDVYVLDDKNRILDSYLVGSRRDNNQRPINHRNFILPLEFEPAQSTYIYVRIRDDGPSVFSIDLWHTNELIAEEQFHLAFIGIIGGALTILFCYFMITYVMLRSPIRFWFAIANAGLLLLFLNIQGIISQLSALGEYSSHGTSVLVGLLILAAAKVSHNMLVNVPAYWRFVSYGLAAAMLVIAAAFNSYWQIILGTAIAGAAVLLHLLLAILFHNRSDNLPNRLYALGWLLISATALLDVSLYLSATTYSVDVDLLLSLIIMAGVLIIAVAIESHEQGLNRAFNASQQDIIANLRQFYDLFNVSAEGLYTATLDGKLVTTNPAMCQLFGYENETQMISEVSHTSQLYASKQDRELLLGEIREKGIVLGKEVKGLRKDGSEFWFSISVQLTQDGEQEYLFGSIFDVTEKKQSNISLEYLATHDSLTGVYNRHEFELKIREALLALKKRKSQVAVLFMDLDQFKIVNDTCGHKAGDSLIKQLSQQLNDVVMHSGVLARLGGDEFGVLLTGEHADTAEDIGSQCLEVVKDFRFVWENRTFTLGLSIGVAFCNDGDVTTEQLLSMADAACYMAKERGRNQIHAYSSEDQKTQRYESELRWISHINNALENDEFSLFYQHYYPLTKKAEGHHYEILLRMHGPEGEFIEPNAFMPAAERYNLTSRIDKWVVEHYFEWLANHPEHAQELERCNINLSGHSLADNELKLFVLHAFEKYRIPYSKICFEITESMAIFKMEETLKFIKTFSNLGCTFALDDFGSGFSSYSYLKNLPIDAVKIDGSFVTDLLVDPIDMAMVTSIKDVAKAMGMYTVAEFVESIDVMVALGKIGVDFAQGYGIAPPQAIEQFVPCRTINPS